MRMRNLSIVMSVFVLLGTVAAIAPAAQAGNGGKGGKGVRENTDLAFTPLVSCPSTRGPAKQCSQINRPDGSLIQVKSSDKRLTDPALDKYSEQLSAQLQGPFGQYKLEDFSETASKVANDQGVDPANLTITVCWNGKKRRWCVGLDSSPI